MPLKHVNPRTQRHVLAKKAETRVIVFVESSDDMEVHSLSGKTTVYTDMYTYMLDEVGLVGAGRKCNQTVTTRTIFQDSSVA